MSLQEEIDESSKQIYTDGYVMSIGELINLYDNEELDIHPEFQRFYRWGIEQKSKFIESILLGIPIPSIFVSQREDGIWDVIDGMQRLSTIFEFIGILKDEDGNILEPSTLIETRYLKSLQGKKWNDANNENDSFTVPQRLEIKRSRLDIKIIKKQSDSNIKYELFQRINSLGTRLSDQELRNCMIIMYDKSFFEYINKLSKYEPFQNCISLSDKDIDERYDLELVLRFFVFKNADLDELGSTKNISDYLTDKGIAFSGSSHFERQKEEEIFKNTFNLLDNTLSENSFKRFNPLKRRFEGKFLITLFETISIGLSKNLDYWNNYDSSKIKEDIEKRAKKISNNENYKESTDRGSRFNTRIKTLIPLGQTIFSGSYEEN